ncbi:NF-kappa-B inhibitor zeta [Xyrichtys novacula]|uniref:NF-kappa-B inhibitor zeta n=1 Tax=Xyrichtys novacula TaxID=13765 RepID=A0AAV1HNN9_XYRNO|nr:NF-kappa-B inhibitor zeta [Xyrichtys novacula]
MQEPRFKCHGWYPCAWAGTTDIYHIVPGLLSVLLINVNHGTKYVYHGNILISLICARCQSPLLHDLPTRKSIQVWHKSSGSLFLISSSAAVQSGVCTIEEKLKRGNETRGSHILPAGNFSQNDKVCVHTDPRPPEFVHVLHKKNTVKELLMMKRQKWACSQDSSSEHQPKFPKSDTFASDTSPPPPGPPVPLNSTVISNFSSIAPGNGPIHPLQGQTTLTDAVKISLFHWQIQKEAQRVGEVSPELLNVQDSDGDTMLHIAVAQGKRALAFVLAGKMSSFGSLDIKEHNGQTALQIAAATNQPFIVQDLLEHGAQINIRDLWGRSPLHVCAEKGHFLTLQSIWRSLMGGRKPVDIEMYNYEGLTPLHTAVLSHNAVIRERRSQGNSCALRVMEQTQRRQMFVECIKTLLLMGASYRTKDLKSGRTCLHMAAEEANVELLHMLLDEASSLSMVNDKTFSGNTALHIVCSLRSLNTQVEATKLLMKKGADPGTRNLENDLPSQLVPDGPVGEKVRRILKGKYCQA